MNERIDRFLKASNTEKLNKIKRYLKRMFLLRGKNLSYIPSAYGKNSKVVYCGPKVSILLPVYNHANVVRQAINSILNQTYKNIEIIILDDGSTDNLLELLNEYKNIPNIKIYTQKNQKLPRALTHLHQYASGDFITWTSADNIMSDSMIEVLTEELIKQPQASLVYGDVFVIDAKGKKYYGMYRDIDRDTKHANIIRLNRCDKPFKLGNDNYVNASFLYRSNDSKLLKGHYASDLVGAEDYDYWLRISKSGDIFHVKKNQPLYSYRVHNNTMSHELETKKLKEHQERLEKLRCYEIQRGNYCNLRPNLDLNNLNKKDYSIINNIALSLPVDVNQDNEKQIVFSNKKINDEIYIKVEDYFYKLVDKIDVVELYRGINIPNIAYKARNNYSHSYYVNDWFLNRPVFGSHINSNNIDIEELKKLILDNSNIIFIVVDEIENKELIKLSKKYYNFFYYRNKEFGTSYEIYSNFSRILCLNSFDIKDKYRNLLLGYAIGRKISYNSKITMYQKYPYTIPYIDNINFFKKDIIKDEDYEIMDRYLMDMSETNSLNKIIQYYNSYTQELYIERPQFKLDIPEESEAKLYK